MEGFVVSLDNLKLAIVGTDINELGGGTLASLIHLCDVMVKFKVSTMADGFDDTFQTIYYEYLNCSEMDVCEHPIQIADATKNILETYGVWKEQFVEEHFVE